MKHTSKLLILLFFLLQFCSIIKAEENTPSAYQELSTGLIGYHFNDTNSMI
ncbi:hypothetical protein [Bacillus cereus]|uniref:hypothetical protein n=1 Tax=Bacillus cereus TaxID=1396 RepID=UPI00211D8513|nr:hypothetical protein [Bacillus cereus]